MNKIVTFQHCFEQKNLQIRFCTKAIVRKHCESIQTKHKFLGKKITPAMLKAQLPLMKLRKARKTSIFENVVLIRLF